MSDKDQDHKDFDDLCSMLPADVSWGDPLTAEIASHIAESACAAAAPAGEPVARPLVWDERDPSLLTNENGFSIELDQNEPDPELRYRASWGEDDGEYFSTPEEAKAWCHRQLDKWVKQVAVYRPASTPDRAVGPSTVFDEAECLKVDPFEGDFGSPCDRVLKDQISTARKGGTCGMCRQEIAPGERVRLLAAVFDGELMSYRWCSACCGAMALSRTDNGEAWEARARIGRETAQQPNEMGGE